MTARQARQRASEARVACKSQNGVCPNFVGLGFRPFRLAVNGQAQAKGRR